MNRLHVASEHLLAEVRDARPSLLLLGGDYAYEREHHREALALLGSLSAECPTFAVRGNTDIRQWFDPRTLSGMLQTTGGDLLMNEAARLEVNRATLEILGVDDPREGNSNPAATLAQSHPGADLRIGIAHSPAQWQELAAFGAHICICGHTHGGQIRIPHLEAPVTHSSYPRRLAAGLFRFAGGPEPVAERVLSHWQVLAADGAPVDVRPGRQGLLYVSRGVGVSWLPLRLFCPPEMVLIELVSDDTNGSVPDGD